MTTQNSDTQNTVNEATDKGVGTEDLLGLGLFVIESRSRHRDKSLGPWKPAAAFPLESNAVASSTNTSPSATCGCGGPTTQISNAGHPASTDEKDREHTPRDAPALRCIDWFAGPTASSKKLRTA